jgi:hypothetical protein
MRRRSGEQAVLAEDRVLWAVPAEKVLIERRSVLFGAGGR